ncbi:MULTISPECIES: IS4 family transposase, partial [unclassified Frankia]|uniref:IS4 family transposase n=1 Tax=unclassified Frankia TaxID=2632575 RepID=UPI002AD36C9C
MEQTGVVLPAGRVTDWISLGVLASWVSRDAVDEAVEETGKAAKRSDGTIPPHVVVYFVMALALFADEDYEEVAASLAGVLADWGAGWEPTSSGLAQARKRLGPEPMAELFREVARPVAQEDTGGAFFDAWRLMSLDAMVFDVEASKKNLAEFGLPGTRDGAEAALPQVRAVTVDECASHAPVLAALGPACAGKATGEQTLARTLYPRFQADWLVTADRNFYNWADWCAADDTGAGLLWRVQADLRLPVQAELGDHSYLSVLINPDIRGRARAALLDAARDRRPLEGAKARYVRVVEYDIPDREGNGKHELFALITNILDPRDAPAIPLAGVYQQRWEHETGNKQLKTYLRGPGRVLRSKSPELVYQEIWGYLLTHFAISALICTAATAAGIDPDRITFT